MAAVSFARRWADGYRIAWEAGDAVAAAALYRDDCVFRSAPFREPEPPIDYTTRVYPEARAEDVRFGEPVEEGDRAAVEWWATLVLPDGEEQAIAGCSMLRFDDQGLVVESRDYWHMEPGRREPHDDLGAVKLGARRRSTAAVAVAFADSSIVVLALPELYGRFNTTIEGVSWVVTAYNAAVAVTALALLLLLVHRLRSAVLLGVGLVLFLAASIACAAAQSLAFLIGARTVQGVGAALLLVGALPVLGRAQLDGGGDVRARARARARWRAHAGVRLAGDLRRAGAGRRARAGRPCARARACRRGGGLEPLARAGRCPRTPASGCSSARSSERSSWPCCS